MSNVTSSGRTRATFRMLRPLGTGDSRAVARAATRAQHHQAIAFRGSLRRRLWPLVAALAVVAALLIPARVEAATGRITTLAGGGAGDGGRPIAASVNPWGMTFDSAGNLYIADSGIANNGVSQDNRVRKVAPGPDGVIGGPGDTDDVITTVAGTGPAGHTGDGGAATQAELNQPTGVAFDAAGDLFITELQGYVREVKTDGTISTVAGLGYSGFSGDGGPAVSAGFSKPEALAVDGSGNIYIADFDDSVVRFVCMQTTTCTALGISVPSGDINTVAGDGNYANPGNNVPATHTAVPNPDGLALDPSGNLYVSAQGASTLLKVDPTGNLTQLPSSSGPAVSVPNGLALGNAGTTLYESDAGNVNVIALNLSTLAATLVAGNGQFADSGDGGPATLAAFITPFGIAVDTRGDVYVSDGYSYDVRKVTQATGIIDAVAGDDHKSYAGDGGPATNAALYVPYGVAYDGAGNTYFADLANCVVREVAAKTGIISTVVGNGVCNRGSGSGDGGPATAAELNQPLGLAHDAAGGLYIGDSSAYNVRFACLSATPCTASGGVVVAPGAITTVAGNGMCASAGDGGPATAASICGPSGLALDGAGDLFVTERGDVRFVAHATGIISTVAGGATSGYAGDGGPATAAELDQPAGLASDASGNLFIADSANNAVRFVCRQAIPCHSVAGRVRPGDIVTVVGTPPLRGFGGDGGPATSASLAGPADVALDSSGNIYISDGGNSRVRFVCGAKKGCSTSVGMVAFGHIATVAGDGTPGFAGDGGPALRAQLDPTFLAVSSTGRVAVSDANDDRIRLISSVLR